MSNFITNSLIKPLAQWYSEINSATLTGAIDVLVIEQDDGTFMSSPFHVRFGKLGVLKAREKVVDIEINGEPVDIQMKLDDNGTAFFVEVDEDGDEEIPPELATSPIPGQVIEHPFLVEAQNSSANRSLIEEFDKVSEEQRKRDRILEGVKESAEKVSSLTGSVKSKLNRKKRKRRQLNHRRNGSKSSLKDFTDPDAPSSESSVEGAPQERADQEDVFEMDDNDNDGDLDDDETDTPVNSSTPQSTHFTPVASKSEFQSEMSTGSNGEQSFLQSRIGSDVETILNSQEKLENESTEVTPVRSNSAYFSEPELAESPSGSRPGTPSEVLSDTEFEMKRQNSSASSKDGEQSWEWGQLPTTQGDKKSEAQASGKSDAEKQQQSKDKRDRRWTFSFWKSSQKEDCTSVQGMYLDDLKDDEELLSLYVGSTRRDQHGIPAVAIDDDAESGNGPSLPMSPHSVEGAIGGKRIRYDSSDEDRYHQSCKQLPDIAFSLCGGLVVPDGQSAEAAPAFSPLLFEQSLISFDDFVIRLKNEDDLFSNPNLVVRIGQQYFTWQAACPIIMSSVLYGRSLPSDLVKIIEGSFQDMTLTSKDASPNGKAAAAKSSSSWWPFGSRKPEMESKPDDSEAKEESIDIEAGGSATAPSDVAPPTKPVSALSVQVETKIEVTVKAEGEEKRIETGSSSECDSDPDLKALSQWASNSPKDTLHEDGKRFKKSLRLTTESIKKLNLKPGANEAQFSVTTAYQGTTWCKCHIYWWKSTDKIVISDIDGTITKSDVLGHVLPIIGRDWAQSGVASLFSKIAANGYQIVYLSARAIGQASVTKDYLSSIKQGDLNLPDGPLFLNPTSLVSAFHREVIEKKPEKFKIACLRDIQKLFPQERNPFYAGYGNRVNDVFAYRTVGIPISRIFTINHKGELRHELTQTFMTSYDCQSSIVDHVFPPITDDADSPSTNQEYSSFAYWREPIPTMESEEA